MQRNTHIMGNNLIPISVPIHFVDGSYMYIQVNEKFCELKGGNIGIVEKAQETRFGMS